MNKILKMFGANKKSKKLVAGLFAIAIMSAPFSASAMTMAEMQAQIASLLAMVQQLQAQLAGQYGGSAVTTTNTQTTTQAGQVQVNDVCPRLGHTLSGGMRGPGVSELQRFLKSQGYYTYPTITGYFGPATEQAVQAFQRAKGIVSWGTPWTTGYGMVGTQTRRAMECGGGTYANTTNFFNVANVSMGMVTFTTDIISAYTSDEKINIDFGDGSEWLELSKELASCQTCFGFSGYSGPPLEIKHAYTRSGTFTARIMSDSGYFKHFKRNVVINSVNTNQAPKIHSFYSNTKFVNKFSNVRLFWNATGVKKCSITEVTSRTFPNLKPQAPAGGLEVKLYAFADDVDVAQANGVSHLQLSCEYGQNNAVIHKDIYVYKKNESGNEITLNITPAGYNNTIRNGSDLVLNWNDPKCGDNGLVFYLRDAVSGNRVAEIGDSHCKGDGGNRTKSKTISFGFNMDEFEKGYMDNGMSMDEKTAFYGDYLKSGREYLVEVETIFEKPKRSGVASRTIKFVSGGRVDCMTSRAKYSFGKTNVCEAGGEGSKIFDTVAGHSCFVDVACKYNNTSNSGVNMITNVVVPNIVKTGRFTYNWELVSGIGSDEVLNVSESLVDGNGNTPGTFCHFGNRMLSNTSKQLSMPRGLSITECPGFITSPNKNYRLRVTGFVCKKSDMGGPFGGECLKDKKIIRGMYSNWFKVETTSTVAVVDAATVSCQSTNNSTIQNGQDETRTRYQNETVEYGQTCQSQNQTRTCGNGSWGSWSGAYGYDSCVVEQVRQCAEYTTNQCPSDKCEVVETSGTNLMGVNWTGLKCVDKGDDADKGEKITIINKHLGSLDIPANAWEFPLIRFKAKNNTNKAVSDVIKIKIQVQHDGHNFFNQIMLRDDSVWSEHGGRVVSGTKQIKINKEMQVSGIRLAPGEEKTYTIVGNTKTTADGRKFSGNKIQVGLTGLRVNGKINNGKPIVGPQHNINVNNYACNGANKSNYVNKCHRGNVSLGSGLAPNNQLASVLEAMKRLLERYKTSH